MQEPFIIKKVAVLGAGVMGAQIAAHCVNAGFSTLLFDLSAKEEGRHNNIVEKAIAHLAKLRPSPLATSHTASLLQARNYEDHLADLSECDLIIEAIAERLDWKEALYQRISPVLNDQSILVSNTSGLSVNALSQSLTEHQKKRFCGVHFFNPPRYMHLAELIATETTDENLLNHLETWLTRYLGKGVVRAKDTPNFIANRIGVFSLLSAMHHAVEMGLGLDEVDALTGVLLGRPKSATFRTMDVVGLDTMAHVVHTMQQQLTDDPWYPLFKLPDWLSNLINKGYLGQKSGQGIYRKNGKSIEVYDVKQDQYQAISGAVHHDIKEMMHLPAQERLQKLFHSNNKQARFLTACFRDLFHYCAYHIETIANTVRDVDLAIRWGFGWKRGPFETWQEAGVVDMKQYIEQAIESGHALSDARLPSWLGQLKDFYTKEGAFSPANKFFTGGSQLPVYKRQFFPDHVINEPRFHTETVYENDGVRLWHLQDNVAVVSFKSKANTIGQAVLDGLSEALTIAERQYEGLILYQHDETNFSSGADLRGVAELIHINRMDALEKMIEQFQQLAMRLKYTSIPTVAALRGRALGGGCELMMHCDRVIAGFESYPGLVEAGVGLIPAGGGCKEMAMAAAMKAADADLMIFIKPYFEQIATGYVASSAPDALQRGYLQNKDAWVMHKNEVLYAALAEIKAMQAQNYTAPLSARFKVAGREGHARLQVGLVNWLEGGFISQHDYFLADQLAAVLCGGDINQGEWVDEAWVLNLEKQVFMTLAGMEKTQARISHVLETGKPLRN
ncbi:3-hydroxyacyl-CoA dehydrogenase/enoyl-CoA hydratase family protein [Legionella nagasakiensis]|uniref:3-hydroxyacyl-CoA dehydrogenase/enoyl-CoA hydratase family protein n=1 Tax=Legionella nagasakiensis TaxID=535290 RepID=UPI00105478FA|nr:3-hydroxyacyl-CoA dehydrogenase/enoyl-CoA hydratase family protein [Legionella nagasakiensis]